MYFTKEDFLQIEAYFKVHAWKDTDFELITRNEIVDDDIFALVHDDTNRKIHFDELKAALGGAVKVSDADVEYGGDSPVQIIFNKDSDKPVTLNLDIPYLNNKGKIDQLFIPYATRDIIGGVKLLGNYNQVTDSYREFPLYKNTNDEFVYTLLPLTSKLITPDEAGIIEKKDYDRIPFLNELNLIPAAYLPSYVDDVIEYDTYDDFPEVGEKGKIYLALDILTQYRWSGSTYVKLDGISLHGISGGKSFTLSNIQNIDVNEPLRIIDIDEVDSGINTCGIEIDYATMFNSHAQKSDTAALVQYNKAIGIYLPQATDERDGAMSYKDKLTLDAIADNFAGALTKDMLGKPNGVATLNESGLVPSSQLPSYVDDVRDCPNYDSLPAEGEQGVIYITTDDNVQYRWDGKAYVRLSTAGLTVVGTDGEEVQSMSYVKTLQFDEDDFELVFHLDGSNKVTAGTTGLGIYDNDDNLWRYYKKLYLDYPLNVQTIKGKSIISIDDASPTTSGLMTAADKKKLDSLSGGNVAIKNVLVTTDTFDEGIHLTQMKDGEEVSIANLTTLTTNLVNVYGPGSEDYYNGDGVEIHVQAISGGSDTIAEDFLKAYSIPIATDTKDGLMSVDDKKKLDSYPDTFSIPVASSSAIGGMKVAGTYNVNETTITLQALVSLTKVSNSSLNNYGMIGPAGSTHYGAVKLYSDTKVKDTVNLTTVAGRYYGVQADSAGHLVVNVPWTNPSGTDGITVDEQGVAKLNLETDEGRTSVTYTIKLQDKDSTKNLLDLTIPAADTSNAGLMSAEDKTKLDSLSTEEEKLCYVNISNLSIVSGGALSGTVSSFKLPDDMTVSEFNDLLRYGQLKTKVSFDIAWNSPSTNYLKGYPKGCIDYIYDDEDLNQIMELPNMSWKKGSRVYLQFIIDGMNITKCTLFGLYTS